MAVRNFFFFFFFCLLSELGLLGEVLQSYPSVKVNFTILTFFVATPISLIYVPYFKL